MKSRAVILCIFLIGIAGAVAGGIYIHGLKHPFHARNRGNTSGAQTPDIHDLASLPVRPTGAGPQATATGLGGTASAKDSAWTDDDMMRRGKAEREANTARFKDKIDFIRGNPDHPDREKALDSIMDECIFRPFVYEEAAYLILEKHKYEVSRGNFHWLYLDGAVREYKMAGDHDLAIQCLNDAITAIETGNLAFDRYDSLRMESPEARAAVIEDLKARIAKVQRDKSGERSPSPFRAPDNRNVSPGNRIVRSGLTPEELAQTEKAKQALVARDIDAAIKIYESMGDRENAAAIMLNKSRGVGLDAGLQVIDDVIVKYPGTVQAGLAEFRRAELYREAGQPNESVRTLKKFVAKQPESPMYGEALYSLAEFAQIDGRTDDAIDYLEQFLEHQRRTEKTVFPLAIDSLVSLYEARGDHEKADKLFKETRAAMERGGLSVPGGGGSALDRLRAAQGLEEQQRIVEQVRERRRSHK